MSLELIFLYIFGEEIRATENFLRDSYLCTGTVGQALSVTDAMFLLFCLKDFHQFSYSSVTQGHNHNNKVVAGVDGLVYPARMCTLTCQCMTWFSRYVEVPEPLGSHVGRRKLYRGVEETALSP